MPMFGDVMKNAENMHKFAKFASHPQAFCRSSMAVQLIISRYDKEHYRHGGHLKRHAASEAS